MPIENEDQAIQALADAGAIDDGTSQPQPVTPAVPDDQAQVPDQPRIDPATLNLSPEAQAYLDQREREMQGDDTRKTQEVAEQRREAEQAMEFINALNTDPSFAQQVAQTLSQSLQQQGYSPQEADAFAAGQGEFADDTFVDPYMDKINQLENWAQQQEQRYAVANAEAQIHAGINAIRAENPSYSDDDIKDVLTMAFAYNGDVVQAHDAFKSITQRVTEGYINQKAAVPSQLNAPSSAGHAEIPPEGFTSLNDPRLEEAAKRMLNEAGAQW
jgi:hypothetical protein